VRLLPGFVLVEAPVSESFQVSTALGRAVRDHVLDRAAQGIFRRSIVTQERNDVARRGESEPQHLRILGR